MGLKQHVLKKSIYFEQKRHVTFALKYIFLVLVIIKCMFYVAQQAFELYLCISHQRLFDDETASGDGDVSLSMIFVVLVVLCNQLHLYWYSI